MLMSREVKMTKFADPVDAAAELSERLLALHLAKHKAKATSSCCVSLAECIDCGDPIPEARRLVVAGCDRCIECQQLIDQQARHYR